MTVDEWRAFLARWNDELLNDPEVARYRLPALRPAAADTRWLGYSGATEARLITAEARLGIHFPPSYRAFLAASDGWTIFGAFIDTVFSVGAVDWLEALDPGYSLAFTRDAAPVPDDRYFVYGPEQDTISIRPEYLRTALQVSAWGDAAVLLLNPQVVTPEGEWEAWFLAAWLPGAARYRSFWDLAHHERLSYLALRADREDEGNDDEED